MTVGMRTTGNTIATGALVAAGIGMATRRMRTQQGGGTPLNYVTLQESPHNNLQQMIPIEPTKSI